MSSPVRPSVCLSSVTFVRPTQVIEIFGNASTPLDTLGIPDLSVKTTIEIQSQNDQLRFEMNI